MKAVRSVCVVCVLLAMLLAGADVLALDHVDKCYGGSVESPNC